MKSDGSKWQSWISRPAQQGGLGNRGTGGGNTPGAGLLRARSGKIPRGKIRAHRRHDGYAGVGLALVLSCPQPEKPGAQYPGLLWDRPSQGKPDRHGRDEGRSQTDKVAGEIAIAGPQGKIGRSGTHGIRRGPAGVPPPRLTGRRNTPLRRVAHGTCCDPPRRSRPPRNRHRADGSRRQC